MRKWRLDFAWPDVKVAVECEGGAYCGGRHTRGKGYEEDCVKYNAALELGWKVFRFTTGMLKKDPHGCVRQVLEAINVSQENPFHQD